MKHNNNISHIEIPAPDLDKAIAFYSSIFNWQIQIIKEKQYAFFKTGNLNAGGGLDASLIPAPEKQGAQIIIDVDNIEETLKDIIEAGGTITLGKTEIGGGHGYYACFRDINGNFLQIHSNQ